MRRVFKRFGGEFLRTIRSSKKDGVGQVDPHINGNSQSLTPPPPLQQLLLPKLLLLQFRCWECLHPKRQIQDIGYNTPTPLNISHLCEIQRREPWTGTQTGGYVLYAPHLAPRLLDVCVTQHEALAYLFLQLPVNLG